MHNGTDHKSGKRKRKCSYSEEIQNGGEWALGPKGYEEVKPENRRGKYQRK